MSADGDRQEVVLPLKKRKRVTPKRFDRKTHLVTLPNFDRKDTDTTTPTARDEPSEYRCSLPPKKRPPFRIPIDPPHVNENADITKRNCSSPPETDAVYANPSNTDGNGGICSTPTDDNLDATINHGPIFVKSTNASVSPNCRAALFDEETDSNNTESFEEIEKSSKGSSNEESGNDDTRDVRNEIVINRKEWEHIAPLSGKRNKPRCLRKGWHQIINSKLEEIHGEGCVFSYIYNRVKSENSRKHHAPFFRGKAQCKRTKCERNIDLIIHDEPTDLCDEVLVYATVNGKVCHDKPERRRLTGDTRTSMARKALDEGIDNVYYQNIEAISEQEYELGDLKSCPSKTVLRKAVNEILQTDLLHKDIIQETIFLRHSYIDDDVDPTYRYAGYIQYVAAEPFTVIMFSQAQIDALVNMARPDLYIDSTGCLIKSFPDQKRPYLYSVVIKPEENLPPVTIADMITTDHTQPSIIHFLTFFQRAVKERSKSFQPRKVEVDWSWALINSTLMAFNCMSLKCYLRVAWDIVHHRVQDEDLSSLTVLHICIAHMTKTFCKHAHQVSGKDKELFRFIMKAFAVLSNETSVESVKEDLSSIFTVYSHIYRRY